MLFGGEVKQVVEKLCVGRKRSLYAWEITSLVQGLTEQRGGKIKTRAFRRPPVVLHLSQDEFVCELQNIYRWNQLMAHVELDRRCNEFYVFGKLLRMTQRTLSVRNCCFFSISCFDKPSCSGIVGGSVTARRWQGDRFHLHVFRPANRLLEV